MDRKEFNQIELFSINHTTLMIEAIYEDR
jgi:hypothetical protein